MKICKIIFSVLLTVSLVVLPPSAKLYVFADDSANNDVGFAVSISPTTVGAGDQVEVLVSLTGYSDESDPIQGLQVDITGIDDSILSVVDYMSLIDDDTAVSNTASYNSTYQRVRLTYVQISGTLSSSVVNVLKATFKIDSNFTSDSDIILPVTVKIVTLTGQQITLSSSCNIVLLNSKQAQTITANDVIVTYGDTGSIVSATTNGNGAISYAVKEGGEDIIDVDEDTGMLTIKMVGTATVIITAAETTDYAQGTKDVTVTVNKATPTVSVPTPAAVTYDPAQTLADVALPTGWAWVDGTTVPTVVNSGYDAVLIVDDSNYDYTGVEGYDAETHTVTRTVMLTVNKAAPIVTAPTGTKQAYTGLEQEIVNAGKATGGTMEYALGTNNTTAPTDGWSTSIPTADNTGTFYVWYKVVGDENYLDSDPRCVTVTIAEKIGDLVSVTIGASGNTSYYDTLEEAFEVANITGQNTDEPITITLYDNIMVTKTISVEADIILDLNGYTVTRG